MERNTTSKETAVVAVPSRPVFGLGWNTGKTSGPVAGVVEVGPRWSTAGAGPRIAAVSRVRRSVFPWQVEGHTRTTAARPGSRVERVDSTVPTGTTPQPSRHRQADRARRRLLRPEAPPPRPARVPVPPNIRTIYTGRLLPRVAPVRAVVTHRKSESFPLPSFLPLREERVPATSHQRWAPATRWR